VELPRWQDFDWVSVPDGYLGWNYPDDKTLSGITQAVRQSNNGYKKDQVI
jgi:hypothetical protein